MTQIDATKKLMGALVRMKPKPHEDMKVGKKNTSSKTKKAKVSKKSKRKSLVA
jgi:hypothetical protein